MNVSSTTLLYFRVTMRKLMYPPCRSISTHDSDIGGGMRKDGRKNKNIISNIYIVVFPSVIEDIVSKQLNTETA